LRFCTILCQIRHRYNASVSARFRNFLLLLPILLLALVLLLWARSYLPEHTFFRSHQGRLMIFFVAGGYAQWFDSNTTQYHSTEEAMDMCRRIAQVQPLPLVRWAGFEWADLNFKSSYPGFVAIPYWAISVVLAALSWWGLARRRSGRERLLPGHCHACGYDLRGSNGKCPECGHQADSPSHTTPAAAAG
jgi:hypothetical protein